MLGTRAFSTFGGGELIKFSRLSIEFSSVSGGADATALVFFGLPPKLRCGSASDPRSAPSGEFWLEPGCTANFVFGFDIIFYV